MKTEQFQLGKDKTPIVAIEDYDGARVKDNVVFAIRRYVNGKVGAVLLSTTVRDLGSVIDGLLANDVKELVETVKKIAEFKFKNQ